jgi:hypothetical protein
MLSMSAVRRFGVSLLSAAGLLLCLAAPAAAQATVNAAVDVSNQYNFRGIRQNFSGASIWPYFDVGGTVYTGMGGLKSVSLDAGMWNAFHSEIDNFTNLDGETSSNTWYEADYFGTVGLGFGGGVTLGTTYTSYTSPGNYWAHIKEVAFKLAVDDSSRLGKGAVKPYGLIAFELDDNGADGVGSRGTYVELGIAPGYSGGKASVSVPIKVGLSASDYYKFGFADDSKFGYFSTAGVVTVPIGKHANVHGGVELQAYGDRLKAVNKFGDSGNRAWDGIASIGIGFTH